ncbi:MAG: hypothetical protein ACK4TA_03840 [Saprospiraceae bacterium]
MKKYVILLLICWSASQVLQAQGPPIMTDKPIMMGAGRSAIMTSVQHRANEMLRFTYIPVMFHHDFSDNFELSFMPSVVFQEQLENRISLGDLAIEAKYQFLRKDAVGRTFRMATRARQVFPTGKNFRTFDLGLGAWQTNFAVVGGIESLKYGLQGELGYTFIYAEKNPENNGEIMPNMLEAKLGFGLPLLKPTYPVNQLNLYFEYEGVYMTGFLHNGIHDYGAQYGIYFAQGIQYAIKQWTIDFSVQVPLSQEMPEHMARKVNVLSGFRFIF